MHVSEILWSKHAPAAGYPPGVVAIPKPIPGTAFFPGGYGLWDAVADSPLPPFPVGGIMVLGQDFHSEQGYRASLESGRGESASQPTWRNLVRLLGEADINLGECFFTNAYVGLRAGSETTGPFPGAGDPHFVAHCRAFLAQQLALQRPTLILTLGIHATRFLASLTPQLAPWCNCHRFRDLDAAGPVRTEVRFPDIPQVSAAVVALTHPSLRVANVRHRRYGGEMGHAAELGMLRDSRAAGSLCTA